MPIKVVPQGNLYTAEVTPPHGGGRPWRSPRPMKVMELVAALKAIGCDQKDISDAFEAAASRSYQLWAEESAPQVRAVLSGERQVPAQTPFTEAWLALALFLGRAPLSLPEIVDGADFIWHAVPGPDQVGWALLRLSRRGWLLVQGNSYGLTDGARRTIEGIVGDREGGVLKGVERLKAWFSTHAPPGGE